MKIAIVLCTLFALTFAGRAYPVNFNEDIQPAGRESIRYPGGMVSLDSDRIVGGSNDVKNAHKYQISLQKKNSAGSWYHTCGGSIIKSNRILTAAHCIDSGYASQYRVVAGEYKLFTNENTEQTVAASSLVYHYNWDEARINYDVGVVRLSKSLTLDGVHTKAVSLAYSLPAGNTRSTVTGWGYLDYYTKVTPITLQKLTTYRYAGHTSGSNNYTPGSYSSIWDSRTQVASFMASNKGICMGDSGGPLVVGDAGEQYGVCSYVLTPCGSGKPDYYANVPYFRSWIMSQ